MVRFQILSTVTALTAPLLLPHFTQATAAQTLLTERTCSRCAVRLHHDVRLGTSDGAGLIAASDVIARSPRTGSFYISQHFDPGIISVFDSAGTFLRTIGRSGRGPGEFLTIMDLIVSGDQLFVFDSRNRRLTILSENDSVLTTIPLAASPHPSGTAVFPDANCVVMASHIQTPDLFGHSLHAFDWKGNRVVTFDTTSGSSFLPRELGVLNRRLTTEGRDIWSAHVGTYTVQKWTTQGRLLRSYRRNVRWFTPWKQRPAISPEGGRVSEIMDVHFDEARGLLWVLVQVPGDEDDWADGLISERGADGRMYYGPSDLNQIYDTIIEAIQVNEGEVVLSLRVEQALRKFVGSDRVISHLSGRSDGIEYIDVWRIVDIPRNVGGSP